MFKEMQDEVSNVLKYGSGANPGLTIHKTLQKGEEHTENLHTQETPY